MSSNGDSKSNIGSIMETKEVASKGENFQNILDGQLNFKKYDATYVHGHDIISVKKKANGNDDEFGDDDDAISKGWCGGCIEGQFVKEKKPPPTPEQIKNRMLQCLPTFLWRELVYYRPQWFGFCVPFVWTLVWWLPVMISTESFDKYTTKDEDQDALVGWPFALMMLFGSLVAGGTSEGGGAVAFPVMTLVFERTSFVARDFSLMIQSVGMTAAAFSILYSNLQIEKHAVLWTNLGGIPGCVLGILFVSPHIPGDVSKMLFVAVWSTFAFALWILNRDEERHVCLEIPRFNRYKGAVLVIVGFVGGIFTSIAGSGIDIMSFSALTLMFHVSEKSATPTSVVLMGCNTCIGFLTQLFLAPYVLSDSVQEDMIPQLDTDIFSNTTTLCEAPFDGGCIAAQTWRYFLCAAIIVPCGAPMGAFLASFVHRLVYAYVVYIFNAIQLVTAFVIVTQTAATGTVFSLGVVLAAIAFYSFTKIGDWLDDSSDDGASSSAAAVTPRAKNTPENASGEVSVELRRV